MTGGQPRNFGIEEEFQLLDAQTGIPVNRAAELVEAASGGAERVEREYFSSQLETATPVCRSGEEAEASLSEFREVVLKRAAGMGILLAGTGLPPVGGEVTGVVTPKARYQHIEAQMRAVAEHQYATGTHVHVEMPSRDAAVDVLARIARWAPALLAMTANSPLWCGETTGFTSWRHVMSLLYPVSGYPQGFEDADDYQRSVAGLISAGVVPDSGMLTWVARLSDNYPTIEMRIADTQLEAPDTVAFGVIVRALADRALEDAQQGAARPRYSTGIVNGADWVAARNGLGSVLIDPLTAEATPAFDLIERMLSTIEGELRRFGDLERVENYVQRLREMGNPASRQLQAFGAGGIEQVLALYRGA